MYVRDYLSTPQEGFKAGQRIGIRQVACVSGCVKRLDDDAIWGFPVQGIWPPCSSGDDINAVDRDKKMKVIVTADDFVPVHPFASVTVTV